MSSSESFFFFFPNHPPFLFFLFFPPGPFSLRKDVSADAAFPPFLGGHIPLPFFLTPLLGSPLAAASSFEFVLTVPPFGGFSQQNDPDGPVFEASTVFFSGAHDRLVYSDVVFRNRSWDPANPHAARP